MDRSIHKKSKVIKRTNLTFKIIAYEDKLHFFRLDIRLYKSKRDTLTSHLIIYFICKNNCAKSLEIATEGISFYNPHSHLI